jgi:hypothetical protein
MHPFQFTQSILFVCADPASSFVFDTTRNNKFHWYGDGLDKSGKYAFIEKEELYLELEWNYGREQTYTVVSVEGYGNAITGFELKDDKAKKVYQFFR